MTKGQTERRFEVTIVGDPCTYSVAAKNADEARAIALLYLVSDRWTVIDTVREVTDAKPTLYLTRGADAWYCDFSATPEANKIQSLFGSTLVPTPYLPSFDVDQVRRIVQARNPRYLVVIR